MTGVVDLPQGDSVGKEGPLGLGGLGITFLMFPPPTWLGEPAGSQAWTYALWSPFACVEPGAI